MTAARFGRLFNCDPFTVLDRPEDDWPLVLAVYRAAARDIDAEVSKRGRQR